MFFSKITTRTSVTLKNLFFYFFRSKQKRNAKHRLARALACGALRRKRNAAGTAPYLFFHLFYVSKQKSKQKIV